jgi:hypothetical protein
MVGSITNLGIDKQVADLVLLVLLLLLLLFEEEVLVVIVAVRYFWNT